MAGLSLAEIMIREGRQVTVYEARSRAGGRIKTHVDGCGYYDLGPAWFWDGQPRIDALIRRFGLTKFEQFSEGMVAFEDQNGRVQHGRGIASMAGSWRLEGGLDALVQSFVQELPKGSLQLNTLVKGLNFGKDGVTLSLENHEDVFGTDVVLALPPRIAQQLHFTPELPQSAISTLSAIPTWMAGQAKVIALFERPFWRDLGLSGDAMSHYGPLAEIHDASPMKGGKGALFGFVGIPHTARGDISQLRVNATMQLVRLFGKDAANPVEFIVKDWARDSLTTRDADLAPLYHHPRYGLPPELIGLYDSRLKFGGTEFAATFGGYLEGALEAAESVWKEIKQSERSGTQFSVSSENQ